MHAAPRRRRRLAALLCALLAVLLVAAPAAGAQSAPPLDWRDCGKPPDVQPSAVQCAMQTVPLDYDRPSGSTIQIAVARVPAKDQAHRIGSLLFNLGGPGARGVDFLQATAGAGPRRGAQRAVRHRRLRPARHGPELAVDRLQGQPGDRLGLYAQPFPTPSTLRPARAAAEGPRATSPAASRSTREHPRARLDRETSRATWTCSAQAVGDAEADATSASPTARSSAPRTPPCSRDRFRALVLDGPVDADEYINDPLTRHRRADRGLRARARALLRGVRGEPDRVRAASAARDPWDAYDRLVARAQETRLPAPRYTPDPRPVDGDDINAAAVSAMYDKQLLARAGAGVRARRARGDGSADPG